MGETFLTTTQVAETLGISGRSLERWRLTGSGPKFIRVGKSVRYASGDISSWLATRRFASTAGADTAKASPR